MFKQLLLILLGWGLFQNTYCLSAQEKIDVEKMVQTLETSEYPSVTKQSVEQLLKLIDDGYWGKIPKEQKERVTEAFLKQLKKGLYVAEKGESEEASRYVQLLGNIAWKIKDERVIPILIDGVSFGYQNALISIGEPAIKPLVNRYGDNTVAGTGNGKWSILEIFKRMGTTKIGNKNRADVRKTLIKACNDEDADVRRVALDALGELGDENDIPIIEKIEKNDPYFYGMDEDTRPFVYAEEQKKFIVREEATKTLGKIRERFKKKPQQLPPGTTQEIKVP